MVLIQWFQTKFILTHIFLFKQKLLGLKMG
jgi:hypothetical protein